MPESERLAQYCVEIQGGILTHKRIFFCSCQGVTRTTVSTIETLAFLLDDKPDIPDRVSEWSTYRSRRQQDNNRRLSLGVRMILEPASSGNRMAHWHIRGCSTVPFASNAAFISSPCALPEASPPLASASLVTVPFLAFFKWRLGVHSSSCPPELVAAMAIGAPTSAGAVALGFLDLGKNLEQE